MNALAGTERIVHEDQVISVVTSQASFGYVLLCYEPRSTNQYRRHA